MPTEKDKVTTEESYTASTILQSERKACGGEKFADAVAG